MNDKQTLFVQEYLIDLNATQAAIRAGYSAKSAASQGERLLRNVEIAKAVEEGMRERGERTQTSADWVIRELVDNHTTAKAKGDIGQSTRCLELIGKHHGAFTDRLETNQPLTVNIIKPDRTRTA